MPEFDPNEPEILALRLAMADALSAWSHLEDALCKLLGTILRSSHTDFGPPVYFAASAAEVRIAIVNRVVCAFCSGLLTGHEMLAVWRKIETKISRARKVRNKLAHGTIVLMSWKGGKHRPLLTGPIFNLDYEATQAPGLSLNDVQASNRTFFFCGETLEQFTEIASLAKKTPYEHDALHRKYHELAARLQKEAARSGARTHPKRGSLPRSSPE